MSKWSKNWQMFLVGKCKVMHFGINSLKIDCTTDGKGLQKVYKEKDL